MNDREALRAVILRLLETEQSPDALASGLLGIAVAALEAEGFTRDEIAGMASRLASPTPAPSGWQS